MNTVVEYFGYSPDPCTSAVYGIYIFPSSRCHLTHCKSPLPSLQHLVERRYQRLRQPETKNEFRPCHEQLRRQTLEEASESLILHHVTKDSETTLRVIKVSVLYPGFYDVERSGNDKRGGGASDGGNEVLAPGSGVVVFESVPPLLRGRGATEQL